MAGQVDGAWSNAILKEAFQSQHVNLINYLNADDVIHELFQARIVTLNDFENIHSLINSTDRNKAQSLVITLHRSKKSSTFIELRKALLSSRNGDKYRFLVENVEKCYKEIEQSAASTAAGILVAPMKNAFDPGDDFTRASESRPHNRNDTVSASTSAGDNMRGATDGTNDVPLDEDEPKNDWMTSYSGETVRKSCDQCRAKDVWSKWFGTWNENFSSAEYCKINAILEVPIIKETDVDKGCMTSLLPYLVQKIKMRGCRVLQANRLTKLFNSENRASYPQHQLEECEATVIGDIDNRVTVSRIDCITCLMNAVDLVVASDLLNTLVQFPMALPLVVQDTRNGGHRVLTSLLRGITIKWECDRIIENSLFIDPYEIILAVRVGDNSPGKSTILNTLFAKEYVFSSQNEPGANDVKPTTLDGSVEFVVLLQEICSDSFWEESMSKFYSTGKSTVYLLANLHGNVLEHMTTFSKLCRLQCKILAFRMPSCTDGQFRGFSDTFNSSESMFVVNVDHEGYVKQRPDLIRTSDSGLLKDYTKQKVRNAILLTVNKPCRVVHSAKSIDKTTAKTLHIVPDIQSAYSRSIVAQIKRNTCINMKNALQQLTKFGRCSSESHVTIAIPDLVDKLLSQFAQILTSKFTESEQALWHLERDLSYLSNKESRQARARVSELRRTLQKKLFDEHDGTDAKLQVRNDLAAAVADVDTINFGLEHFHRSLEKLYVCNSKLSNKIHVTQLPRYIADLVIRGHSMELFNGDENTMPASWLNDIFIHIDKLFPGLKIFVVSVIGLQSSGKSTLLNSLFACRFAVSVGRCSRGLFMRLLLVDQALPQYSEFNAILLIDTEGLGSPEKMNDPLADRKDRLLATFAMGISNLTIINVLGENMKELTEILQIAVVTMARLEKARITPDILMIQHLLTEKNSDKTSQAEEQFCSALKTAVELTERMDVQVGVRNSACLRKMYERIQNGTLLMQFHPYKDGATVNSPPSEAYHNDIVKLYQRILDNGMQPGNSIKFKEWYELVEAFWESVTKEDFALRFKNVREVYDFIERGKKIEAVKQAINYAFHCHESKLCDFIESETKDLKTKDQRSELRLHVENHVKQSLSGIPAICELNCHKCQAATEQKLQLFEFVAGKACEHDTQETISRYEKLVLDASVKKLMQIFESITIRKGCSAEFDSEIRGHLCKLLHNEPGGKMQKQLVDKTANEVFTKLCEISKRLDGNVEEVRVKIRQELRHTYHQVADFCKRFDETIDLEELISSESKKIKPIKVCRNLVASFKQKFMKDETTKKSVLDLIRCLQDIPTIVIQTAGVNSFQSGLTEPVSSQVNDCLNSFVRCVGKLSHDEKFDVHACVQQLLCQRMEVLQVEWDKVNRPSFILRQNRDSYIYEIETQLTYGFNSKSEGLIMAQHLKRAVNRTASIAEHEFRINTVKDLVWITNSEKVRLKYFTWLAERVDEGQKEQALFHFKDPRKAIEQWFRKEVDSFRSQTVGRAFVNVKQRELKYLLSQVKKATSCSELYGLVETQSASRNGLPYRPSFLRTECIDENFGILRDTIITELQAADDDSDNSDIQTVTPPSADAEIMSRLGCTARCHWCGALCWGQRGHDQNADDTRKHHSSHQPRGLAMVRDKNSRRLISRPCHETSDDTNVHFGEYKDSGLPWKIAKEEHFSEWKFDRHYNVKFDELMRWFFQELHVDLAKTSSDVLPAKQKDLTEYGCSDLKLPEIMVRMKAIIS